MAEPDIDALVLIAPHPDDEVLGLGAFTAALTDRGVPVTIVAVTDGDASHPGSPTHTPAALAELRRRESATAAAVLGVTEIVHLGLPDGAVTDHEDRLGELLAPHLPAGATVAVPFHADGHPDHEATARAGAAAARARGLLVLQYPIWLWHWSRPDDPDIDWTRARRLPATPGGAERKRRAALAFTSQIAPLSAHPADRAVLPAHVLARLLDLPEVVFE
ncbi:PIG-L deacetylase family protein [Nocardia asteroides]|uniref:PIG-L deacetylase family protein n=1 Tax=Nocardia asteroides TaxID=1824 RepID=UPI001E3CF33D|nr:PIG-L family deacetylase [Nocardia asteroides]UGT60338.1 PIG-L family deacetylase [Nocardia asteroides]